MAQTPTTSTQNLTVNVNALSNAASDSTSSSQSPVSATSRDGTYAVISAARRFVGGGKLYMYTCSCSVNLA